MKINGLPCGFQVYTNANEAECSIRIEFVKLRENVEKRVLKTKLGYLIDPDWLETHTPHLFLAISEMIMSYPNYYRWCQYMSVLGSTDSKSIPSAYVTIYPIILFTKNLTL